MPDPFLSQSGRDPGLMAPSRVDTPVASMVAPQGNLPFGGGGNPFAGLGGSPQQAMAALPNSYAQSYNAALQMNQQNYANILKGYQDTLAQQQQQQQQVSQGYQNLSNSVLSGIAGIGQARSQEIADQFAAQRGAATQGLITSGLGNTTVTSSVQRGISADESKARTQLADQLAGLRASYESNLGLAGLAYQGQAAGQNSALAQRQLDFMNSVMAQYPSAGLYAQLAQQYGAAQEANRNRNQLAGGSQAPNFGLQRLPGTGGGLTRNPDLFAPNYDVGGGANYAGFGLPSPGSGAATALGVTPGEIAGYGKGETGNLWPAFGRTARDVADVSGAGAAAEPQYGYDPIYGAQTGYGGAYGQPQSAATGYMNDLGGGWGMDLSGYVYGDF